MTPGKMDIDKMDVIPAIDPTPDREDRIPIIPPEPNKMDTDSMELEPWVPLDPDREDRVPVIPPQPTDGDENVPEVPAEPQMLFEVKSARMLQEGAGKKKETFTLDNDTFTGDVCTEHMCLFDGDSTE